MANLGLLDELVKAHEVWFCLRCRKCESVCPNRVKPADIVSFARAEMSRRHLRPATIVEAYQGIFAEFQSIRWQVADSCMRGEAINASSQEWNRLLALPIRQPGADIELRPNHKAASEFKELFASASPSICQTCSECSNTCPVLASRSIFDPQLIIRMINYGFINALLHSPCIWLCIGCKQCADACSQLVKPCLAIERLKQMAENMGIVPFGFAHRFEVTEKGFYQIFIDKVDGILNDFSEIKANA